MLNGWNIHAPRNCPESSTLTEVKYASIARKIQAWHGCEERRDVKEEDKEFKNTRVHKPHEKER
jgi:hypothetical protein